MIGPSHSACDGRDALPRVRRDMSGRSFLVPLRTRSWAMGAEALSHLATPDRAGARPYQLHFLGTGNAGSRGSGSLTVTTASANQIGETSRSACDGRDALPRVRRDMYRLSFLVPLRTRSWAMGAEALAHLATPDRAGARPYQLHFLGTGNAGSRGSGSLTVTTASANQIGETSRSACDGRDALPRVRRDMYRLSFLVPLRTRSWAMGAEALAHLATPDRAGAGPYQLHFLGTGNAGSRGSASLPVALSRDGQRRIARERVPTSCTLSGRARPDRAGARPYRRNGIS